MNIIPLYQCEVCGKESRKKETIESHEIECKERDKQKKRYAKNKKKWDEEFLLNFDPNNILKSLNDYLKKVNGDSFPDIWYEVHYDENVSNSHHAPINGVTNWGSEEGKPTGYPGFHGHIRGRTSKKGNSLSDYCGGWISEVSIPGLHTGSGGSASKPWDWQYDFRFFLDDFPNLKKQFEERHIVKQAKANLSGDYNYTIQEEYVYYGKI